MNTLSLNELENLQGGDFGDFCTGFQAVAITYAVGAALNWWNPVGQSTALVGAGILAACWIAN